MTQEKPSTESAKPNAPEDFSNKEEKEKEIGGFENRPEPTRYGDWDVNGRCSDF